MDYKKLFKYKGRKAISPIVATLILIIIAIVGAVSVGLIMSGIASSTSKAANPNTTNAAESILIGGSTTLFPAVSAAATAYNAANGVNIVVQQGGSGAGMEGVAEGVLSIGDASSFSAVASAVSEYPTANLQAQEVGGSGVVVIINPTSGSDIATCHGITLAALQGLYTDGYGTMAGACTGTNYVIDVAAGTLTNSETLTPTATACVGTTVTCVIAVSRGDLPSGTEDTMCSYLANVCASTSNNAVDLPGVTQTGNPGVLSYVQKTEGAIGFVDIGFAEGADVTPGSTTAAGVNIPQIQTSDLVANQVVDAACGTTGSANCYALNGGTTAELDSFIKASLNVAGGTLTAPVYPDSTSGTGLTRTFWMVTSGTPSTTESQFLTYIRSPAATSFWNNAGYYSLYQLTPITPP